MLHVNFNSLCSPIETEAGSPSGCRPTSQPTVINSPPNLSPSVLLHLIHCVGHCRLIMCDPSCVIAGARQRGVDFWRPSDTYKGCGIETLQCLVGLRLDWICCFKKCSSTNIRLKCKDFGLREGKLKFWVECGI